MMTQKKKSHNCDGITSIEVLTLQHGKYLATLKYMHLIILFLFKANCVTVKLMYGSRMDQIHRYA